MSNKKTVCNSSPIILASKIDFIPVLKKMFRHIYIADAVYREITSKEDPQIEDIVEDGFLQVKSIRNIEYADILSKFLGKGEVESIILGKETRADLLIIDDKKGRYYAESTGLKAIGIVGLIIQAYQNKLIEDPEELLKRLRTAGFWIKKELMDKILKTIRYPRIIKD